VKPYYDDGICTIYHSDCMDVLPTLSDVDLVFTSPPYNLGGAPWPHLGHWKPGDSPGGKGKWRSGADGSDGVSYAEHEDTLPHEEYVAWQQKCLFAMWATLDDNGAIFYNHKPRVVGGRLWLPLELNPDLPLRQIIVWARPGGMNFNPTAFMPTHEWIMVLAKEDWRLKNKGVSGLGDVWKVAPDENDHPAPFPVGLPARAIEATAPDLVLDPFMGSGSTLRAAKDAGVRCIGIEKSERYCQMAVDRLAQEAFDFGPQQPTLVDVHTDVV
jgi:modification methylase